MRFVLLVSLIAAACAQDFFFGIGTLFDGTDLQYMQRGSCVAVHVGDTCTAVFRVEAARAVLATESPRLCTPRCLRRGFRILESVGVFGLLPRGYACPEEAVRVRKARVVNETTQHLLSDSNVVYFDTF
jgi:hypothetical protein